MKGAYRDICENYCSSNYDVLPEDRYYTIDDYISKSKLTLLDFAVLIGTSSSSSSYQRLEFFLGAQITKAGLFRHGFIKK